jgi:carbohydrate kinase (thermoresistant glucokinase family)
MGVSGAGKTAVGRRLAERQSWPFLDGDDLHPASNVRKMAAGEPLTDQDRLPWLSKVREVIREHAATGSSAVIACSALKRSYRRLLLEGQPDAKLVYLRGEPDLLWRRLTERRSHFFDPGLLSSQLETLEEPVNAVVVDIDADLETVTDRVATALGL